MELEKNVMKNFINYLKEHGYPESSLATEYKIGTKNRVDLLVIDPITTTPIMIFELKSKKTDQFIKNGKEQLRMYLNYLPDSTIPAYLVFPKNEQPYFEVLRANPSEEENEIESIDSIDYNSQRIARLSEMVKQTENEKKETLGKFSFLAWTLALLITVLLILNKVLVLELDIIDLTLLVGILGLILLPFASKVKFLGIEFERFNKAKYQDKLDN